MHVYNTTNQAPRPPCSPPLLSTHKLRAFASNSSSSSTSSSIRRADGGEEERYRSISESWDSWGVVWMWRKYGC